MQEAVQEFSTSQRFKGTCNHRLRYRSMNFCFGAVLCIVTHASQPVRASQQKKVNHKNTTKYDHDTTTAEFQLPLLRRMQKPLWRRTETYNNYKHVKAVLEYKTTLHYTPRSLWVIGVVEWVVVVHQLILHFTQCTWNLNQSTTLLNIHWMCLLTHTLFLSLCSL